jgi:hypothetical protein
MNRRFSNYLIDQIQHYDYDYEQVRHGVANASFDQSKRVIRQRISDQLEIIWTEKLLQCRTYIQDAVFTRTVINELLNYDI